MPKKLLLVEDDPVEGMLIADSISALEALDVEVVVVTDGQQARHYLRANPPGTPGSPSVVFLDLMMPNVTGFEVLRDVQKLAGAAGLPIVVFTASHADADIYLSYRFGANAFVIKPREPGRLQAVAKIAATFWLHSNVLPPPR